MKAPSDLTGYQAQRSLTWPDAEGGYAAVRAPVITRGTPPEDRGGVVEVPDETSTWRLHLGSYARLG